MRYLAMFLFFFLIYSELLLLYADFYTWVLFLRRYKKRKSVPEEGDREAYRHLDKFEIFSVHHLQICSTMHNHSKLNYYFPRCWAILYNSLFALLKNDCILCNSHHLLFKFGIILDAKTKSKTNNN